MQEFPSVSFIIFGYNQERFIDAAIEGALAQDYPHLEIILSDDCSSDDTFARMEAAARQYEGPHRVKAVRSPANAGTLAHVYRAAGIATGDLLVLAAGDDVSRPDRVAVTARRWLETNAAALFSTYDIIGDDGALLVRDYRFDHSWLPYQAYFPDQPVTPIHGASSAYDRRTLLAIPRPDVPIVFEDAFFTLMLLSAGKRIAFIDQPLVNYRRHDDSTTNARAPSGDLATITRLEQVAQRRAAQFGAVLEHFREAIRRYPPATRIDTAPLDRDIAFYRYRARWLDASLVTRLQALSRIRRRADRRWAVARVLGLKPYFWLRSLQQAVRHRR